MNKQEIFSTVAAHLLRQNAPSYNETGFSTTACAYRGNNGMKCAVGILIKDEHYKPELEGNTPYDWNVEEAIRKSIGRLLDKQDLELLVKLQDVHDFRAPDNWEKSLESIAHRYNFLYDPEQLKEAP